MAGSPPNLPVPKGWKPPPGTNKPITKYVPKPPSMKGLTGSSGPYSRPPTGPGYGVLRPGVRSAPAPRPAPTFKPEGRLFSGNNKPSSGGIFGRPLGQATRENMITGGLLHGPWREQHPQAAARQYQAEHHVGLFGKALGLLGEGERAIESGAVSGINALGSLPGVTGKFGHLESPTEQRAVRGLYGKAGVQAAETIGTIGGGAALKGLGLAKETAAGTKAVAEREGLDQAAKAALRGETIARGASGQLDHLAQVGGEIGKKTVLSRAAKVAGGTAAGYGKLLGGATAAHAYSEVAPEGARTPKKNEPFAEKFWHDAVKTVENLPAGTISAATDPIKTAEAMAQLYTNPSHAFDENPFGTMLAFLAPTTALDRGMGALGRWATKDKLFSMKRPDLAYASGQPMARQYQPGAIINSLQKGPDRFAKLVGKGEKIAYAHLPDLREATTDPKILKRLTQQATKHQEMRDIIGSRYGGIFRPGQVDYVRQGERLSRNLEVMKRARFLHEHLPTDQHHGTAFMQMFEGYARRPSMFWTDIAGRIDQLEQSRLKMKDPQDIAYNQKQLSDLKELEDHRSEISNKDLEHYAKATDKVAQWQRLDWELRNQEGLGEPGQLNARNVQAVLTHGPRMYGPLEYRETGPTHPLVDQRSKVNRALAQAKREVAQAEGRGKSVRELTGGNGPNVRLELARQRRDELLEHANAISNKLQTARFTQGLTPDYKLPAGIYKENGDRVTGAEVDALLKQEFGGRELGYVPQNQEEIMARSLNSFGPRTTFASRTGGNAMKGAYDNTPAALRDHFENVGRTLATMRGSRSVIENLARVGPDGRPFKDQGTAEKFAHVLNRPDSPDQAVFQHLGKWVAVDIGAKKVANLIEGQPFGKFLEQHGLTETGGGKLDTGTWAVLPEKIATRLNKWEEIEHSHLMQNFRMGTTPWRQANLYTSVRWPVGVTQENAIRLAFHQVSPLVVLPLGKHTSLSFKTGSDINRFLDEKISDPTVPPAQKQAAIFHRSMFGTGNFTGAQLHELEPALHKVTGKLKEMAARNPVNVGFGPRFSIGNKEFQIGWRPYRKFVGDSLNAMEKNSKVAAGGKLALNDQNFFSKFRQISREQAAHDYVEKITTDPAQSIKAAQNLLEIMGNYTHLTPWTRIGQMTIAPFALWWLNSAKFVFKTLPRDHPYATGLLAAMTTATGASDRNLREYLEGTVPLHLPILGDINLNPVHYSPFDIAKEAGGPTAAGMIAPQYYEPISTLKGVEPLTGEKFVGEKEGEGTPLTALGRGIVGLIESWVPGARLAAQIANEGGRKGKEQWLPGEIKPGTGKGITKGVLKSFSPLMFNYRKAPPKKEPEPTGITREGVTREPVTREPVTREPVGR